MGLEIPEKQDGKCTPREPESIILICRRRKAQSKNAEVIWGWWEFAMWHSCGKGPGTLGRQSSTCCSKAQASLPGVSDKEPGVLLQKDVHEHWWFLRTTVLSCWAPKRWVLGDSHKLGRQAQVEKGDSPSLFLNIETERANDQGACNQSPLSAKILTENTYVLVRFLLLWPNKQPKWELCVLY